MENHTYQIYKDIQSRTNGAVYLGVVGPVRTGKSTFIKRFMDCIVLPNMEDDAQRQRATDELPQSSAGKTIMTTEPKFVPNNIAKIKIDDIKGLWNGMLNSITVEYYEDKFDEDLYYNE